MTKIIDGYAQPDVVAIQCGKKQIIFVETVESYRENIEALVMTLRELPLGRFGDYKLEDIREIRIEIVEGTESLGGKEK